MLALQPPSHFDRYNVSYGPAIVQAPPPHTPRASDIAPLAVLSHPAEYYAPPHPPNQDATAPTNSDRLLTEQYSFPKREEFSSPSFNHPPHAYAAHPEQRSYYDPLTGPRHLVQHRYSYPPPVPPLPARHMSDPSVDPYSSYSQQAHYPPYPPRPAPGPSPRSSLTFSSMSEQRPGTAGSTTSSGWDHPDASPADPSLSAQSTTYATLPPTSAPAEDPVSPLHSNFSGSNASTSSAQHPIVQSSPQYQSSPQFQYQPATQPLEEDSNSDPRPGSSGYLSGETDPYARHQPASSRPSSSSGALGPSQALPAPGLTEQRSPDVPEALIGGPSDPHAASKTYSFVSLPGNAVKKRPRRRYDEIERLYHCSWPNCSKSYGTLNHLNAHIVMQRHGNKRTPAEFKELRKQWRKAKKEEQDRALSARLAAESGGLGLHPQYAIPHPHHNPLPDTRIQSGLRHPYPPQVPMGLPMHPLSGPGINDRYSLGMNELPSSSSPPMGVRYGPQPHQQLMYPSSVPSSQGSVGQEASSSVAPMNFGGWNPSLDADNFSSPARQEAHPSMTQAESWSTPGSVASELGRRNSLPAPSVQSYMLRSPAESHVSVQQQRRNTLPPDSTLFTPLPGYQPTAEYEEEEQEGPRYSGW